MRMNLPGSAIWYLVSDYTCDNVVVVVLTFKKVSRCMRSLKDSERVRVVTVCNAFGYAHLLGVFQSCHGISDAALCMPTKIMIAETYHPLSRFIRLMLCRCRSIPATMPGTPATLSKKTFLDHIRSAHGYGICYTTIVHT